MASISVNDDPGSFKAIRGINDARVNTGQAVEIAESFTPVLFSGYSSETDND